MLIYSKGRLLWNKRVFCLLKVVWRMEIQIKFHYFPFLQISYLNQKILNTESFRCHLIGTLKSLTFGTIKGKKQKWFFFYLLYLQRHDYDSLCSVNEWEDNQGSRLLYITISDESVDKITSLGLIEMNSGSSFNLPCQTTSPSESH